jgi:phosphoribosyl-ATP pyrophosphohydrolase/phosphoribosyl-AMP cyclohydrolase
VATETMRIDIDPSTLDWTKGDGLLPVIVQDAGNLRVLMLGYMNREALDATLASRRVTFFSRSKQRLWTKGESSGHVLELVSVEADCDDDTLLVLAHPQGPTCHLQRPSCFPSAPSAFLSDLEALVAQRDRERPVDSYTTRLFDAGVRRIAQKVGEEGVETALAAVAQDETALLGESADLLYHLTVLLRARGLSLAEAVDVLRQRHAST